MLLFTAAQLSVVHEYTHDDDDNLECSVCIIAQDFQSQSFDAAVSVSYDLVSPAIIKDQVITDLAFAKADTQPTIHTTRPPPVS